VIRSNLIIAALLFASTVAIAQRPHYTATLAQPLSSNKEVVANNNLWRCSGSTCTLTSQPKDPGAAASCRTLRKKVGALSAYGAPNDSFDAEKLAKCNAD
jgi:hypothetical protein